MARLRYVKYGLRLRPRNFWTTYGNDGHCGREEEPREFSDLVRARDEDQLMPQENHLFTKKQLQKKDQYSSKYLVP